MSERLAVIADERRFETEVLALRGLVLVGFWADWSGACHVMTPVVEAVARELEGRVKVLLVDVDRAPALKSRYGVESVPACLFFDGGRLVDQVLGTVPRRVLMERAANLLGGGAMGER